MKKTLILLLTIVLIAGMVAGCVQEQSPETIPTTDPMTEPPTEPTTEPTTEPITEPTTEPTEPPTEPTEPPVDIFTAGYGDTVKIDNSVYDPESYVFVHHEGQLDTDADLQPGYVYLREDYSYGPYIQILDEPCELIMESTYGHAFICTESNKLIHFSMITGKTAVLYEGVYGNLICPVYYYPDSPMVLFLDGEHVMQYDLQEDAVEEIVCIEGVTWVKPVPQNRLAIQIGSAFYAYDISTGALSEKPVNMENFVTTGNWPN